MKAVELLILIALIYITKAQLKEFPIYNCAEYAPGEKNPEAYSLDFCRSTRFDTSRYVRCCFIKYEDNDDNDRRHYHCYPIDLARFNDIDDTIDKLETNNNWDIKSLDCGSSYLYFPLILIIAFIL